MKVMTLHEETNIPKGKDCKNTVNKLLQEFNQLTNLIKEIKPEDDPAVKHKLPHHKVRNEIKISKRKVSYIFLKYY